MRMVSLLIVACLAFVGLDKSIGCDHVQQFVAPVVVSPVVQQYSAVQFAQVQPVYAAPIVQQVYAAPVVQQAVVQRVVQQRVIQRNVVQKVVQQPVRRLKTVTIQKFR